MDADNSPAITIVAESFDVNPMKGDADEDCDIDIVDLTEMFTRFEGPDVVPGDPTYVRFDVDDDEDVDLADFAALQTRVGQVCGDPGDDCTTAWEISTNGSWVQGVIDPSTDEDWFEFAVQAGHPYLIALERVTQGWYPVAQLIDADCTTSLAWVWSGGAEVYVAPGDGVLYVRVLADMADGSGVYELQVTDLWQSGDDHRNTYATGTLIPTDGSIVPGQIDYVYDVDWFRFVAAEQTVYDVEFRALSPDLCVQATVWRPGGSTAGQDYACDPDGWVTVPVYVGTGPFEVRVSVEP